MNIIRNISYLEEDYIPDVIKHRDSQLKEIAKNISYFIKEGISSNVLLYGKPGTGKTLSVKFLFEKLREETSKVIPIYINCWKHSKGMSFLLEMASHIDEKIENAILFKRSFSEGYFLIMRYLKKEKKKVILALDEVDKLEEESILYLLTRDKIPLIMISNTEYALKDVDERIKSSLIYTTIHFKEYSFNEMMDILEERHKYAFFPSSFPRSFIKVCASNAKGDARIGIGMMKSAALIAEKKGKERVEIEDIKESIEVVKKMKINQMLLTLKREHVLLYKIIEEEGEIKSSELYNRFKSILGKEINERTFRNYVKVLVEKGLIESKGETRWRIYSLPSSLEK